MDHSEVTVQTATGHQQGSPPNVQGINTVPAGFHQPRLPEQVIHNSSWDESQEDRVHDGDIQDEESLRREGGSVPVHLQQLPEDRNRGRKPHNKAEEGANSPRVFALRKLVTEIKVKFFPHELRSGNIFSKYMSLRQHFWQREVLEGKSLK